MSVVAASQPLGTNTEFVRRSSPESPVLKQNYRFAARVERYELQAVARSLLPAERIRVCMVCAGPTGARVVYSPQRQSAHLAGVMVCGSPWICPVCATRISERRRGEVAAAVAYVERSGRRMVLSTFTLSHAPTDSLVASLAALNGAYRRMHRRRDFAALRASYGLSESIKAVEVTWGADSGFHPHLHVLQAVSPGVEVAALRRDLAGAWLPSLRSAGFRASVAHGVDVTAAWDEVAEYVSKLGRKWGAPEELTKANSKRGRAGRFTPADLLRSVRDSGDQVHAARFVEYAGAMKGTRQLRWSPGFKKRVGILDRSDEDLAANWLDDDRWTYVLAHLAPADWAAVRYCGPAACAELESAGDTGDRDQVAAVVERCRSRYFAEAWGF